MKTNTSSPANWIPNLGAWELSEGTIVVISDIIPTSMHKLCMQVKDKGIHVLLSPRAEGFVPQMLVSTDTEVRQTYRHTLQ